MAAAVLEIVKRITGFIVGVLIGLHDGKMGIQKNMESKETFSCEGDFYQIPAMDDCALLVFLFLVAIDLLGYAAITYLPVF